MGKEASPRNGNQKSGGGSWSSSDLPTQKSVVPPAVASSLGLGLRPRPNAARASNSEGGTSPAPARSPPATSAKALGAGTVLRPKAGPKATAAGRPPAAGTGTPPRPPGANTPGASAARTNPGPRPVGPGQSSGRPPPPLVRVPSLEAKAAAPAAKAAGQASTKTETKTEAEAATGSTEIGSSLPASGPAARTQTPQKGGGAGTTSSLTRTQTPPKGAPAEKGSAALSRDAAPGGGGGTTSSSTRTQTPPKGTPAEKGSAPSADASPASAAGKTGTGAATPATNAASKIAPGSTSPATSAAKAAGGSTPPPKAAPKALSGAAASTPPATPKATTGPTTTAANATAPKEAATKDAKNSTGSSASPNVSKPAAAGATGNSATPSPTGSSGTTTAAAGGGAPPPAGMLAILGSMSDFLASVSSEAAGGYSEEQRRGCIACALRLLKPELGNVLSRLHSLAATCWQHAASSDLATIKALAVLLGVSIAANKDSLDEMIAWRLARQSAEAWKREHQLTALALLLKAPPKAASEAELAQRVLNSAQSIATAALCVLLAASAGNSLDEAKASVVLKLSERGSQGSAAKGKTYPELAILGLLLGCDAKEAAILSQASKAVWAKSSQNAIKSLASGSTLPSPRPAATNASSPAQAAQTFELSKVRALLKEPYERQISALQSMLRPKRDDRDKAEVWRESGLVRSLAAKAKTTSGELLHLALGMVLGVSGGAEGADGNNSSEKLAMLLRRICDGVRPLATGELRLAAFACLLQTGTQPEAVLLKVVQQINTKSLSKSLASDILECVLLQESLAPADGKERVPASHAALLAALQRASDISAEARRSLEALLPPKPAAPAPPLAKQRRPEPAPPPAKRAKAEPKPKAAERVVKEAKDEVKEEEMKEAKAEEKPLADKGKKEELIPKEEKKEAPKKPVPIVTRPKSAPAPPPAAEPMDTKEAKDAKDGKDKGKPAEKPKEEKQPPSKDAKVKAVEETVKDTSMKEAVKEPLDEDMKDEDDEAEESDDNDDDEPNAWNALKALVEDEEEEEPEDDEDEDNEAAGDTENAKAEENDNENEKAEDEEEDEDNDDEGEEEEGLDELEDELGGFSESDAGSYGGSDLDALHFSDSDIESVECSDENADKPELKQTSGGLLTSMVMGGSLHSEEKPRDRGRKPLVVEFPQMIWKGDDICVLQKPADWICSASDVDKKKGRKLDPNEDLRNKGFKIMKDLLDFKFQEREKKYIHWWIQLKHEADREQFPNLFDVDQNYGLCHRLDRETSGTVLVGVTKKSRTQMRECFHRHYVRKLYVCLVHGYIDKAEQTVDRNLEAMGQKAKLDRRGKRARTHVKVLGYFTKTHKSGRVDEYTLCTCEIAEGRMHQIRLHMSAALGAPIVSEFYYQKAKQMIEDRRWCQRVFLHAYAVGFPDMGRANDPHDEDGEGAPEEDEEEKLRVEDTEQEWHCCICPLGNELRKVLKALKPRDFQLKGVQAENCLKSCLETGLINPTHKEVHCKGTQTRTNLIDEVYFPWSSKVNPIAVGDLVKVRSDAWQRQKQQAQIQQQQKERQEKQQQRAEERQRQRAERAERQDRRSDSRGDDKREKGPIALRPKAKARVSGRGPRSPRARKRVGSPGGKRRLGRGRPRSPGPPPPARERSQEQSLSPDDQITVPPVRQGNRRLRSRSGGRQMRRRSLSLRRRPPSGPGPIRRSVSARRRGKRRKRDGMWSSGRALSPAGEPRGGSWSQPQSLARPRRGGSGGLAGPG